MKNPGRKVGVFFLGDVKELASATDHCGVYRFAKGMMMARWMVLAAAAVAASGCTTTDGSSASTDTATASTSGGSARAILRTAAGAEVGRATAREAGGAIRISVEASQQTPGTHGVHVHTIGRCDGPDFTTAGGHWNPTAMQHGTQNPAGPHAGDLPNMTVGADGRGQLTMDLPSGTLAGLMDADGSAFIIHAGADDLKSDPAGNSGGRVACGVFEAG